MDGDGVPQSVGGWVTAVASRSPNDVDGCKTALDGLLTWTSSVSTESNAQLATDDCHALLSALVRLVKDLLQGGGAQDATTRATTSALRCIIAIVDHGPPDILSRTSQRVHELAALCLTVLASITATPTLRSRTSASSLSQLRRPGSQASMHFQQTGALAFANVARPSRTTEAHAGQHSRSSSTSSWRAPDTPSQVGAAPSSPVKPSIRAPSPANSFASQVLRLPDSEESGSEAGRGTKSDRGDPSRACKYYCISCLAHLNKKEARLLFQEWSALFGQPRVSLRHGTTVNILTMTTAEQALSVRTAAVQLCESALEQTSRAGLLIAIDDRPQRSTAFTSLAVRTGSVVADMRSAIASILAAAHLGRSPGDTSSALTIAALKAARALQAASPNPGYKQRSALALTPPVIALCSSTDPSTAAAAFAALSELMGASSQPAAKLSIQPLDSVLSQLAQPATNDTAVRTQAWKALQAMVEQSPETSNTSIARVAALCRRSNQHTTPELERQAATSALSGMLYSLAKHSEAQIKGDTRPEMEEAFAALQAAAGDPSAVVRCAAVDGILPLAHNHTSSRSQAHSLLVAMLGDREAAVCAAAARTIGVAFDGGFAKSALLSEASSDGTELAVHSALQTAYNLLARGSLQAAEFKEDVSGSLTSSAIITRLRASWSFATMCDKCANDPSISEEGPDLKPMLRTALALCTDDDRLVANGLRALGALLRMLTEGQLSDQAYGIEMRGAVRTMRRALRTASDPKTRWNAGAAFERAFYNVELVRALSVLEPADRTGIAPNPGSTARTALADVVDDLTASVTEDKMYKVKLAALHALRRLGAVSESDIALRHAVAGLFEAQRTRLEGVRRELDARMEEAAFKERQLHIEPCRKALDALLARVDSSSMPSSS